MSTTKMKTILVAVLAAFVLALGAGVLVTPAFAADATITVNGNQTGHKYEAYQIFVGDKVADADNETTGAKDELTAVQWGDALSDPHKKAFIKAAQEDTATFGTMGEEGTNPFKDIKIGADDPVPDAPVVANAISKLNDAQAKALAKILDKLVDPEKAKALTEGTEENAKKYSYTGPEGYYLIKDKDTTQTDKENGYYTSVILQVVPGADNVVDVKGSAPESDKGVLNNETKTVSVADGTGYNETADYNVGDAVPFRLHGTLSGNLADFDQYEYAFIDTQATGFDAVDQTSVQVIVKHKTGENAYDYYLLDASQYSLAQNNKEFTVAVGAEVDKAGSDPAVQIRDLKAIDLVSAKKITLDDGKFTYDEDGKLVTTEVTGDPIKITADDEIIVTYKAKLNEDVWSNDDANFTAAKNTMHVSYSNKTTDNGSKGQTPDESTYTFSFKIDVTKYSDQANPAYDAAKEAAGEGDEDFDPDYVKGQKPNLPLAGAGFVLTRTVGTTTQVATFVTDTETNKTTVVWVDAPTTPKAWAQMTDAEKAEWATDNNALKTSDADGKFNFKGIDIGTYTLEEVVVPEGYRKATNKTVKVEASYKDTSDTDTTKVVDPNTFKITVTDNGIDTISDGDANSDTVKMDVQNTSGAELPETGGMGTVLFTVGGIALMLVAAVAFLVRRRSQE